MLTYTFITFARNAYHSFTENSLVYGNVIIVKGNKKGFFRYISNNMKTTENMGTLLKEAGDLMTKGVRKAKVLNATFTSDFTGKICLHHSVAPEATGKAWSKKYCCSVEDDRVREHLKNMDIPISVGPDGLHPQALSELANVWGHYW